MPAPVLDTVRQILARDSRLGHDPSASIDDLMDLLYYGEFGILEQVASGPHGDVVNLVGSKGPPGVGGGLWLMSCTATSALPFPSRWASTGGDCFAARVDESAGCLYGLGAASEKVDFALKLLAASAVRAETLKKPVVVVAMFGNEASATGTPTVLAGADTPDAVLLGAPTNLELWTDHPGCVALRLGIAREVRYRRMPPSRGFFKVVVEGASAHAQCQSLGVDALELTLTTLTAWRAHGDVRVLAIECGEAPNRVPGRAELLIATSDDELPPLPAGVSVEPLPDGAVIPFPVDDLADAWLTARDAGVAAVRDALEAEGNIVGARPRRAVHTGGLSSDRDAMRGTLTFWTGPGCDHRAVVERFAHAASAALTGREGLSLDIQMLQDRPAFRGAEGAGALMPAARRALRAAGLPAVAGAGCLTTDAGITGGRDIPTLVFGPGRGDTHLYRDDECTPLLQLDAAYRFYCELIRAWCT
ncbi:MAG: M20/M25/M40 family metallo-hydrolase [Deltaproteobacteria bacterium]|nr:M20/M25/M40 family metallo-hydrolase [Deltaproteobacteria bacterium]MCB9788051.1 M20/M25/M40 family metallo-hydrolase [Deltaproteobacteria bacterium]